MLIRFITFIVKVFIRMVFRVHIHGEENYPMEGAVIVALNHKSNWDGPLAAVMLPRPLCFMGKKILFKIPILKGILKRAGAIPVNRNGFDISAIKAALSALRSGKSIGIFPEGRRVFEGEAPSAAKGGVAMIAEKTGAPIVPVAIRGNYRLWARLDLYIGTPITVKAAEGKLSGEQLQQIAEDVMDIIFKMAETGETV